MVLVVRVEEACVHRVVVVGIVDTLVLLAEVDSFVEDIGDVHNVDLPVVDVEYKPIIYYLFSYNKKQTKQCKIERLHNKLFIKS